MVLSYVICCGVIVLINSLCKKNLIYVQAKQADVYLRLFPSYLTLPKRFLLY
jgi:hypothetical protein